MRLLTSIIALLTLGSCNNNSKIDIIHLPPEKSKLLIVKLTDSLGDVSLSLPLRYDTSFIWTHQSDCGKPCDKIKYRFQPKVLKIVKESGWYYKEYEGSIERFTIIHSGYFPFYDNNDTSFIFKAHSRLKEELVKQPETNKIKWDTVEKIGDRYFSILTVDLYDSVKSQYSKKLLGAATIKGNGISFHFELLTKQRGQATDSFLNNCLFYSRTIRISKEQ